MTEPAEASPAHGREVPDARPAGRREQHKQHTRRALEDAALTLFARNGFDATTVEAIADRAAVSPRTFFRYFATKDEVLDMGWATRRERLHALTVAAPHGLTDLAAALVALEEMARDFEPERDRVRLRAEAVASSAALRGRSTDTMVAWEAALARGLAGRRGLDRPDEQAAVAAAAAMGVWRWATRRWIGASSVVPVEALAVLVRRGAALL